MLTTANSLSSISVTQLKGVGAATAEKLTKLNLLNVHDLLFHLPYRYQDRTRLCPIRQARPGDEVLVQGKIEHAEIVTGRRRSLLCRISDCGSQLQLRFFHFSSTQKNAFKTGATIRCFGEIRFSNAGKEMIHPEYSLPKSDDAPLETHLSPIYPTTEGLSQSLLRKLLQQALALSYKTDSLTELLPATIRQQFHWPPLLESIQFIHHPPALVNLYQLENGQLRQRQRLALEELLAHHLSLLQLRAAIKKQTAIACTSKSKVLKSFLQQLPFTPTAAQQRVCNDIQKDLAEPHPMLRLVQGDVGSGKTLVAAIAALQVIEQGYQVAIMAPTEILAEQHLETFSEWFAPLGIQIGWLSGKLKGKKREAQLALISNGESQLVIGTHALFQDDVTYHSLAFAIIDEQHRFGVHQRLSLSQKSQQQLSPHQLIMTATPIPRTLAMSAYADLDTSVIDELPPGRKPVKTVVLGEDHRDAVISRVQHACQQGKQVYWVCTLIEESEALQCQAAEDAAVLLKEMLPNIKVGLVHGRMKATEKAEIMSAFKDASLQLLIATTVIEVGVNVPNASIMIIENSERLGLSQLHQLRGRVGRGSEESFCLLLYKAPLSQQGKERLQIMKDTNDGFKIAEKDLEIRGPGEVLGTRQTGDMQFRIADLMRDQDLVPQAKQLAQNIIEHHPESIDPLIQRWLGSATEYGQV